MRSSELKRLEEERAAARIAAAVRRRRRKGKGWNERALRWELEAEFRRYGLVIHEEER